MSTDLRSLGTIVQDRQRSWRAEAAADRRVAGDRATDGPRSRRAAWAVTIIRRLGVGLRGAETRIANEERA